VGQRVLSWIFQITGLARLLLLQSRHRTLRSRWVEGCNLGLSLARACNEPPAVPTPSGGSLHFCHSPGFVRELTAEDKLGNDGGGLCSDSGQAGLLFFIELAQYKLGGLGFLGDI
jgi:hypothetical protein